MRAAEMRGARHFLGQSIRTWGELLHVSPGTVKNWETGKYPVPGGVESEVRALEEYTRRCVGAVVSAVGEDVPGMVVVWRAEESMPAGPARVLGLGWWQSVASRARERVPGLVVGYPEELDVLTGSRDRTLAVAVGPSVLPPITPRE